MGRASAVAAVGCSTDSFQDKIASYQTLKTEFDEFRQQAEQNLDSERQKQASLQQALDAADDNHARAVMELQAKHSADVNELEITCTQV